MTRIKVEVDASSVLRGIERLANGVEPRVAAAVYSVGASLLTDVRRKASTGYHRRGLGHIPGTGPGPNVATGDYRRSINLTTGSEGGSPVAVVATNAPQARRLEYGFTGADALGRMYRQPPYPHWRPAAQEIGPKLQAAVRAALLDALRDR